MIKCPDLSFIDLNFKLKASSSDTHTKYIPEAALDLPSPPFPHPSNTLSCHIPSPGLGVTCGWFLSPAFTTYILKLLSVPTPQSNHLCRHPENDQAGSYHLTASTTTTYSPPAWTSISHHHCRAQLLLFF